jgi:hypothetical protein
VCKNAGALQQTGMQSFKPRSYPTYLFCLQLEECVRQLEEARTELRRLKQPMKEASLDCNGPSFKAQPDNAMKDLTADGRS